LTLASLTLASFTLASLALASLALASFALASLALASLALASLALARVTLLPLTAEPTVDGFLVDLVEGFELIKDFFVIAIGFSPKLEIEILYAIPLCIPRAKSRQLFKLFWNTLIFIQLARILSTRNI
jgi:hypothetical protein